MTCRACASDNNCMALKEFVPIEECFSFVVERESPKRQARAFT